MSLSWILRTFIVALCCGPILSAWSLPALSEDVLTTRAGEPAKSKAATASRSLVRQPPRTILFSGAL